MNNPKHNMLYVADILLIGLLLVLQFCNFSPIWRINQKRIDFGQEGKLRCLQLPQLNG